MSSLPKRARTEGDAVKSSGSIPLTRSATIRGMAFLLLVASVIGLWIYTDSIINHVRDFQRSVVKTHVLIHLSIIDPSSTIDDGIGSELWETVIIETRYPIIITDAGGSIIQGLWKNVGIAPDDTSVAAMRTLEGLVARMDRVNDPEPFAPRLETRIDTLTVYELPTIQNARVAVTDEEETVLHIRNIPAGPEDSTAVRSAIAQLDSYTAPAVFRRPGQAVLRFHSPQARGRWPLIVAVNDSIVHWRDVGVASNDTTAAGRARLAAQITTIRERGQVYSFPRTYTVLGDEQWLFHYGDLPFVTLIGWLPIIELVMILILLSIGVIGLLNIKNAEQRSIWVGMAKETAHQLGTPISSLSGWIELLKTDLDDAMLRDTLPNMEDDVNRLTRVAARFSNVGSRPELKPVAPAEVLDAVLDYFSVRLPRMGKEVRLERAYDGLRPVLGNAELLNWAFENIVKNALSAFEDGVGRITVTGTMSKDFRHVILDFSDTGRGIQHADQKRIMRPGFTTRKRGWGLGLSLVKRIVVDYHGGRFHLVESRQGEGTTFRVVLPAMARVKGADA